MGYGFTADEIKEVVRAARIYCPGFSERQYQDMIELEERLKDSRYLEAVRDLTRLEEEKGTSCAEALDACQRLLRNREELEREVAGLQKKLAARREANREAEDRYRQLEGAIRQAQSELKAIQADLQEAEKELVAVKKKAQRERNRVDKEVEEYRQRANVTKEEIATASQLNAQLASHGFSLELVLGLCHELAGHENAREELARALTECETLRSYIAHLKEQAESQKKALEVELNRLQSERDRRQAEVTRLEEIDQQLEGTLSQLQADVAEQEELRGFYRRYHGLSGLMECLANWNQIIFLRCNNPLSALAGVFDRSAGRAHFWTDRPATKCPHCGLTMLLYDEKPYQTLNWPVGAPLRLQLGE